MQQEKSTSSSAGAATLIHRLTSIVERLDPAQLFTSVQPLEVELGSGDGSFLVNYAKTYFTAALPEYWLYALGALFVVVTLFLPRGVVGLLERLRPAPAVRAAGAAP